MFPLANRQVPGRIDSAKRGGALRTGLNTGANDASTLKRAAGSRAVQRPFGLSSLLKMAPRSRALDSRFRGNDGKGKVFSSGHPRESGDPGEAGLFQQPVRSLRELEPCNPTNQYVPLRTFRMISRISSA